MGPLFDKQHFRRNVVKGHIRNSKKRLVRAAGQKIFNIFIPDLDSKRLAF